MRSRTHILWLAIILGCNLTGCDKDDSDSSGDTSEEGKEKQDGGDGGHGGSSAESHDASHDTNEPTDASSAPDGCAGDPSNPSECPCTRPVQGQSCAPKDLSCLYDPEICNCKYGEFYCSLPLFQ